MDIQIAAQKKNKYVTHRKFLSMSGSGTKNYAADVIVQVILFGKIVTLYTADKQALSTNYVMYVDGNDIPAMSNSDVFVIDTLALPVLKVEPFYHTDSTVNYWEVYL